MSNGFRLRKKQTVFTLLVGLLILIVGCGKSTNQLSDQEGKQIADQFLQAIRSGQVDQAWNQTGAEFKSFMGKDAFRAYVKSHPVLKGKADFETLQQSTTDELPIAECRFRPNTGKGTIKVMLAPEEGKWWVERIIVE